MEQEIKYSEFRFIYHNNKNNPIIVLCPLILKILLADFILFLFKMFIIDTIANVPHFHPLYPPQPISLLD